MSAEVLQGFLESLKGQITVVVIIGLLLFGIMIISSKEKMNTKALTYSAIMIVMAFVLNQVTLFKMPQGGSVTPFSMFIIVLIAYFFGTRQGIMAGMAFGLLDLLINPYAVHPVQILLDYPFAFGALGLAGLTRNMKHGLVSGYIIGIASRFVCAFLSGVIFWGMYAPEGFSAVTWAIVYNITYIGAEGIMTVVLVSIPAVKNLINRVKKSI